VKNNIKVERAKQNISQEDLANMVGVSRQTINSIERGRFVPSTVIALKIAGVFKCRVEDIFELEDGE
jgi:putative transcriptional regulator